MERMTGLSVRETSRRGVEDAARTAGETLIVLAPHPSEPATRYAPGIAPESSISRS
jgi:hypothetical protein